MSAGRWLRPLRGVSAPTTIVSVACEARAATDREGGRRTPLRLARVHATAARRRRGKWCPAGSGTWESGCEFHDWLEQFAQEGRNTYVFSPVASNALTLTGFWCRLTDAGASWGGPGGGGRPDPPAGRADGGYAVREVILRGRPDIVRYSRDGRTIVWLSGHQYLDLPLAELARATGYPDPLGRAADGGAADRTYPAREVARVWLHALAHLSDWWLRVKGGPWSYTVGGLALGYFRSRLAPRTVLLHRDGTAGQLETAALWGGRASVFYAGDVSSPKMGDGPHLPRPPLSPWGSVDGPATLVDVRSMYPFLLATQTYPVRLAGTIVGASVKAVSDLLDDYGVIASIQLDTPHAEYPHRRGERVTYPTGRFNTVLAGPELARAVKEGAIRQVYRLAYYTLGRPAEGMSRALIDMREEYRRSGNQGWELFVKLLSNSIAGKFAQRRSRWERRPGTAAEVEWGEWLTVNHHGKLTAVHRALAGLVWEKVQAPEQRRSMGQIFAYLTSYGREYMRSVREHCPPGSVISQDTDGLWVLPDGLAALHNAGLLRDGSPGTLRVVASAARGRWWGPKHYWTDLGWVLAGLTAGVSWCGGVDFLDRNQSNPVWSGVDHPPDEVSEYARRVALTAIPQDGTVGPLGWVQPLHLI